MVTRSSGAQAEWTQALSSVGQEWAAPPAPGSPECTYSQMKVPWGMVCRARTPQPILAVR